MHSTRETEICWQSEWGYSTIFTKFSSSRAGVGILFNNNFQFQISKYLVDPEGRFIIADIEIQDKTLTLVNIYAPNKNEPTFFQNVCEKLSSFDCDFIIFGGDFNLVGDIHKDKKGGIPTTHLKSRDEVEILKENFELTDIWRVLNPDATRFTWRRKNPEIQCRLDYFLISNTLCPVITNAEILPGYRTDHSMITVRINTVANPRGPGFWKLNTHLLTESEYINLIRKTITDVSKQYEGQKEVDEILLWDVIKMQIRATSIKYAKEKKSRLKQKEYFLEKEILALERKLEENNPSEPHKEILQTELRIKKQQLEEIIGYKTQGAIIRSKVKWYNEGERNTKYFHSLEKRHFNSKTIRNLVTDDGTRISTDVEILQEAKNYYESLYTSITNNELCNEYDDIFFPENFQAKLTDDQKLSCEGELSATECFASLKTMEMGRSPGTDGLPAEFYKVFWNDVSTYLLASLNSSFSKGHLSISQRRGLITLIPKKNKPQQYLKNWRPISLLNCDYKIAAKAVATRMKRVLPDIINNDQTGFLKGRSIGENVRLLNSVISYAEQQNIPGMLLFIDFEKAFDTLEWKFLEKTLRFYNFGDSLITWIKLLYTDISSSIQNDGWSSEFFQLNRGVRQGCPLSPYLFILCVEILGNAIRNSDQIKGICVLDSECKISQYADDTTLILDGSEKSMQQSFSLLDSFTSISGLRINYEKTEALWIGTMRFQRRKIAAYQNISWPSHKVKALGVWLSTIKEEATTLNYEEKKETISKTIENWQFRRLTLLGKIVVIKSLLASQLVYIMSPLPTSSEHLKDINNLLYQFLWDGKRDKIKRAEMINDYATGGLKMLDIQTFNRALKAKWIQKYLDSRNKGKWKLFLDFFLAKYNANLLITGNLNVADAASLEIDDPFTKELIEIWSRLNFKRQPSDFSSIPIWYNSLVRIDNKPIYYKSWYKAGILFQNHLLDENLHFLTFDAFKEKYSVKINFLQYQSVVSAVSKMKSICTCSQAVTNTVEEQNNLLASTEFCKLAYTILIKQITSIPHKSQSKWLSDCNSQSVDCIDWRSSYGLAFLCTRESKLRTFQFKFLHRRIATNSYLFKIGITSDNLCSFCKERPETILHMFWECIFIQAFWNSIKQWMSKRPCFPNDVFSFQSCLGFVDNASNILSHHFLLICRYHIHWSKLMHLFPSPALCIQNFLTCLEVERRYALQNGNLEKFNVKWGAFRRENNL